jgi:DNA-binding MarR family transcriptional regulator
MDSAPALAQLLLQRFRWMDDALRASLESSGWPAISGPQSLVFAYVAAEGSTTTELARRIGVTRQAVQQTVAGLLRDGLLEPVGSGSDRRERGVRLTRLGQRNVAAALAVFDGLERHLEERIGRDRLDVVRVALAADWGEAPQIDAPRPT